MAKSKQQEQVTVEIPSETAPKQQEQVTVEIPSGTKNPEAPLTRKEVEALLEEVRKSRQENKELSEEVRKSRQENKELSEKLAQQSTQKTTSKAETQRVIKASEVDTKHFEALIDEAFEKLAEEYPDAIKIALSRVSTHSHPGTDALRKNQRRVYSDEPDLQSVDSLTGGFHNTDCRKAPLEESTLTFHVFDSEKSSRIVNITVSTPEAAAQKINALRKVK